ncbi:caspase-2-like [Chrysoperla carnea]|uniref:caspase-2-like n=1 Tax=Chrysoperla carnea TaxID=189513 RepID=UPI001D0780FA|nr:caspase-2-like [Chrysoperla carnea]
MDFTDSSNYLNIEKNKMKIIVKYADQMKNAVKATENLVAEILSDTESINPPYSMRGSKTGVALVINNIKFENKNVNVKLDERTGADVDTENLKELFTQMGYEWVYWENQTWEDLKVNLKKFTDNSNELLKEVNSCFVIVMSHGGQGDVPEDTHIYTSDNKKIKASDIIGRFNSSCCNLLQDKPKFIIFQACRGDLQDLALNKPPEIIKNYQPTAMTETSTPQDHIKDITIGKTPENNNKTVESDNTGTISSIIETNITIPSMSDVFIYYTTSPGFLSYRDPSKGTWFVQYFCEVFMNHVYNTDVRDLFGMITKKVMDLRTTNHALQVPHSAIRGKFQPCFLYPALKTIDVNQETNEVDERLLNLAKEIEQNTEITKIEDELKKFI